MTEAEVLNPKRMKKQFLLIVAMVVASVAHADNGDTFEYNGLNFRVISEEDHKVEVVKTRNISGSIEIPAVAVNGSLRYCVTSLGLYAFESCSGLTSVIIPNSVTEIGSNAFFGCSGLTSVVIPGSVTEIGNSPFCYCSNLTEIKVENGNTAYSATDGVLFNFDKTELIQFPGAKTEYVIPNSVTKIRNYAFQGCSGLTSIIIPNSVTEIGWRTFYDCSSLTSVVIPASITAIGNRVFEGCVKLTKIYDLNPTPQTLGENTFGKVPENAIVFVPKGRVKAYSAAEGWKHFTDFRETDKI